MTRSQPSHAADGARRAIPAIVLIVGITAILVVAADRAAGPQVEDVRVPPESRTTVIDGIVVDIAPPVSEIPGLERLDTMLPATLRLARESTMQLAPERELPLSRAPVDRALALVRIVGLRGGDDNPIYVVGADRRPRLIDLANLTLAGDVNPEVIRTIEVLSTTLSPDDTRAAFIHRDDEVADGVLVIDLTSAEARRYPIAGPLGFHARVIWHPDGQELVIEDHELEQTLLLDLATGQERVDLHDDLASPYGWDRDTSGWRHGDLVARTQPAEPSLEQGSVVLVIDLKSGEAVRGLHLPAFETNAAGRAVRTRGPDGPPVLGWLDEETVLLSDAGVVAWNVRTGQLHLVAVLEEGPGGAPIGYGAVGDLRR